jgi:hypothetical protein
MKWPPSPKPKDHGVGEQIVLAEDVLEGSALTNVSALARTYG